MVSRKLSPYQMKFEFPFNKEVVKILPADYLLPSLVHGYASWLLSEIIIGNIRVWVEMKYKSSWQMQ